MEQVPKVGIVGSGKLTRHLEFYLHFLNIDISVWNNPRIPVGSELDHCNIIFLAVADSSIELVAKQLQSFSGILVHCSGALSIKGVLGAHPLMTFSDSLYDTKVYRAIPFIIEDSAEFPYDKSIKLLNFLPNPLIKIDAADKALYHALCVLGGNLSTMLWREAFRCAKNIGLDRDIFYPYLNQITENLKSDEDVVTGPIARRDQITINKNLEALSGNPYKDIYESFVRLQ